MGCVYKITNKHTGKSYIGRTLRTLDIRWKEHIKGDRKRKSFFHLAIREWGEDAFEREILTSSVCPAELEVQEILSIRKYNTKVPRGYNSYSGGRGGCVSLSEEVKQKLSDINKGKKLSEETKKKISSTSKGRKLSEETKLKISLGNRGKIRAPEVREAISRKLMGQPNGWLGRKHTQETKDKISRSDRKLRGRKRSEETKSKISESRKRMFLDGVLDRDTKRKI